MSRFKGVGGQRGAWRRQQATSQLIQQAQRVPSFTSRPAFLQAQLAPVFELLQSALESAYSAELAWPTVEHAVLQHLTQLLHSDAELAWNARLLHALLFEACEPVRQLVAPAGDMHDGGCFTVHPGWRLPTVAYASITAQLGWGRLAANCVLWLPDASQHAPALIAALLDHSLELAAPLSAALLRPGAATFSTPQSHHQLSATREQPSGSMPSPAQNGLGSIAAPSGINAEGSGSSGAAPVPACPPMVAEALLECIARHAGVILAGATAADRLACLLQVCRYASWCMSEDFQSLLDAAQAAPEQPPQSPGQSQQASPLQAEMAAAESELSALSTREGETSEVGHEVGDAEGDSSAAAQARSQRQLTSDMPAELPASLQAAAGAAPAALQELLAEWPDELALDPTRQRPGAGTATDEAAQGRMQERTCRELQELSGRLDSCMAADIAALAAGGAGMSDGARKLFQVRCHLKTRLQLLGILAIPHSTPDATPLAIHHDGSLNQPELDRPEEGSDSDGAASAERPEHGAAQEEGAPKTAISQQSPNLSEGPMTGSCSLSLGGQGGTFFERCLKRQQESPATLAAQGAAASSNVLQTNSRSKGTGGGSDGADDATMSLAALAVLRALPSSPYTAELAVFLERTGLTNGADGTAAGRDDGGLGWGEAGGGTGVETGGGAGLATAAARDHAVRIGRALMQKGLPGVPAGSTLPERIGGGATASWQAWDALGPDPYARLPLALTLTRMLSQCAAEPWLQGDPRRLSHGLCTLLAEAAGITDPTQRRALLQAVMNAEEYAPLVAYLEADREMQDAARQALIALSNRMIADENARAFLYDDAPKKVELFARGLLPLALLAPRATLARLVIDGLTHSGQAAVVADIIRELHPLGRPQTSGRQDLTGATDSGPPTLLETLRQMLGETGQRVEASDAAMATHVGFVAELMTAPSGAREPLLQAGQVLLEIVGPSVCGAASLSWEGRPPIQHASLELLLRIGIAAVPATAPPRGAFLGQTRNVGQRGAEPLWVALAALADGSLPGSAATSAEPVDADDALEEEEEDTPSASRQGLPGNVRGLVLELLEVGVARCASDAAAGLASGSPREREAVLKHCSALLQLSQRLPHTAKWRLLPALLLAAGCERPRPLHTLQSSHPERDGSAAKEGLATLLHGGLLPAWLERLVGGRGEEAALSGPGGESGTAFARAAVELASSVMPSGPDISSAEQDASLSAIAQTWLGSSSTSTSSNSSGGAYTPTPLSSAVAGVLGWQPSGPAECTAVAADSLAFCGVEAGHARLLAACCLALAGQPLLQEGQETLGSPVAAVAGGSAALAAALALALMATPLQQLQPALLRACCAALPNQPQPHFDRVVGVALPAVLAAVKMQCAVSEAPAPPRTAAHPFRPTERAAALEVVCRAAYSLASEPGSSDAPKQAAAALLQRLASLCQRLTTADHTSAPGPALSTRPPPIASTTQGLSVAGFAAAGVAREDGCGREAAAEEARALAQWCVSTMCGLAGALQGRGVDCAPLQLLLLHLLKVVLLVELEGDASSRDAARLTVPGSGGGSYARLVGWASGQVRRAPEPMRGILCFAVEQLVDDHLFALARGQEG